MKKYLLFAAANLLWSSLSLAGSQVGQIALLLAHNDGNGIEKVDVELDGQSTDIDWCSTRQQWSFVLDSDIARAQFSMLLAAYSSGRSVTIDSDTEKSCIYTTRNRVRNVRLY